AVVLDGCIIVRCARAVAVAADVYIGGAVDGDGDGGVIVVERTVVVGNPLLSSRRVVFDGDVVEERRRAVCSAGHVHVSELICGHGQSLVPAVAGAVITADPQHLANAAVLDSEYIGELIGSVASAGHNDIADGVSHDGVGSVELGGV